MKKPTSTALHKPLLAIVALLGASTTVLHAGDSPKTIELPSTDLADPWRFSFALPGWLASTSGTIGVNGVSSDLYVGVDKIITNLDMVASLSGEARKGRFGVYGDLLYISASDGIGQSGLVEKVAVRLDQYLINLELNYRVLEGPRGFVDVRAGVRYTNLYNKMTLSPNDEAIDSASTNLVDNVGELVASRLAALDLRGTLRTALEQRIGGFTDRIGGVDGRRPQLPIAPISAGAPGRAGAVARVAIDRRLDALAAALQAEAAATTERLREEARSRINAVKKQIARDIATELKKDLDTTASLAEDWWDPYVGVRARLNLSKAFYLTAKADIGGFGVGSDLTWQASGALGCQLTPSLYTEIGYHYLYTDYNHNGFVYDVYQSGVEINAGITF